MSSPEKAAALLADLRTEDGGFAPAPGGESEPEPTALAALALDDAPARQWLADHQQDDGAFLVGPKAIRNDTATALAAIAADGPVRDRALDYLANHPAQPIGFDERFPHDESTRGWGWTSRTFGWVEPTARAVMALKLHRPDAAEIADGIAVLADRECSGGGWNYGNPEVLGRSLEPFLQTTAVGLIAVQNAPADLRDRAVAVVESLWPNEQGGLGWAMAVTGLRLARRNASRFADELATLVDETELRNDAVALAWAVLALGDGWEQLRIGAP